MIRQTKQTLPPHPPFLISRSSAKNPLQTKYHPCLYTTFFLKLKLISQVTQLLAVKFSLDPMLCNPQSGANRAAKESFNKSIKTLKETRCQYNSNLKTRASSAAFSTTTALFSLEPARVTNNDPPPHTHTSGWRWTLLAYTKETSRYVMPMPT